MSLPASKHWAVTGNEPPEIHSCREAVRKKFFCNAPKSKKPASLTLTEVFSYLS